MSKSLLSMFLIASVVLAISQITLGVIMPFYIVFAAAIVTFTLVFIVDNFYYLLIYVAGWLWLMMKTGDSVTPSFLWRWFLNFLYSFTSLKY